MHFQLMMKLAALGAMVFVSDAVADAGALHVRVTGFKSSDGALAIALFKNEADYESQSNAVERAWLDIDAGEVEWILDSVPPGVYALIAYHDVNGNKEIDFRFFGMPKEPVGVSNNARGRFGPPRFEAASFAVRGGLVTRQHLRLR